MSYDHVFNEMEVAADPFALCELQGRCALGLGRQSGAILHYILAGRGEIIIEGQAPIPIERGTLALIPTMRAHSLHNYGEPGHPIPDCRPAELDLAFHLQSENLGSKDNAGASLLAICSHISIGIRGTHKLINLVRDPLAEQVDEDAEMAGAVRTLLLELSQPTLGSQAMIRALLLQCAISLWRKRLLTDDPGLRWMIALTDKNLWSALELMLEAPGAAHSVESLAEIVGISRSSFASKFTAAYGHGPMELLRELRMHLAASLLQQSDLPIKRIAQRAGFSSRSAFTRTFKAAYDQSPQTYRAASR